MLDDSTTSANTEIDIDIGHRDTFRIQESLEKKFVLDRIDIRDPQAVCNERSCGRTAARPDRNILFAGISDEVPHDQEIAGKAHTLDRVDLASEPLSINVQAVL